ncbi:Holliday junction branch migration protein RuvA [Candidatus Kaiserbacteria bacterium]|nr:Holliday junction branch migration protein RuvA [Candidatus Kaiserbacteria bacterium]
MIGFLEGIIHSKRLTYCILLVSGVGYKIFATKQSLAPLSPQLPASFWTHLAVKEDAQDLYGFVTEEELRFFEMLLTVSGIGPKSALGILDIASVETLRSAIGHGKSEYLTKVSGIGRKTAEKIVVELRDKVGASSEGADAALKGDHEALEALKSLGYSQQEARDALRKVPASLEKSNERLREALKILGGA